MRKYSFENLDVWNETRRLIKAIYKLSSSFPQEEKFGITSQIRRATISISSNIAEGSSRKSFKDQARFTVIAYGSLMEVLSLLILASDLNFVDPKNLGEVRLMIEDISSKLSKLRESQQKRTSN